MNNKNIIKDCDRIQAVGDAAEALLYLLFERSKIEVVQNGCIRFTPEGQVAFDYLYNLIEWTLQEHITLPLYPEVVQP